MPRKALLHSIVDDGVSFTRVSTEDKLWAALRAGQGSTCAELAQAAGLGRSTAAKILARWAAENLAVRNATAPNGAGRAPERWSIPYQAVTGPASAPVDPATEDEPAAEARNDVNPADLPVRHDAVDGADQGTTAELGDRPGDADAASAVTTSASPAAAESADNDADKGEPPVAPEPGQPVAPTTGTARARRLPAGGLRGMVEDYLRERPDAAFGPSQIGKDLARSSGAVANALGKLVEAGCVVVAQDRPRRYALAPTETAASEPTPDNTTT
jgi:predicted transcriptional regulator